MIYANIGDRIKGLREGKGYSLRELASLCQMSKSALGMYERGERRPKYETLVSIANVFDVDIDYLLGKTDNPQRRGLRIGRGINSNIAHNIQHPALFDIEDLQIIKSNSRRDVKDIFITPEVAIRWTRNGRPYGCFVGFYGASREPTAEEVIEAVNKLLQYFLLTARELAKQNN